MEAELTIAHPVVGEAGTWEGRMVWREGWGEAGECWRKDSTNIPYGPSENTRSESEGRGLVIPGKLSTVIIYTLRQLSFTCIG